MVDILIPIQPPSSVQDTIEVSQVFKFHGRKLNYTHTDDGEGELVRRVPKDDYSLLLKWQLIQT